MKASNVPQAIQCKLLYEIEYCFSLYIYINKYFKCKNNKLLRRLIMNEVRGDDKSIRDETKDMVVKKDIT